jgi:isoamylase
MPAFEIGPGSAHPAGVSASPGGVNFSLFSQAATEVVLLLFEHPTDLEPMQTVRLDPFKNKTFHFWHVFVRGCGTHISYAYRIDGPARPSEGHRFNANKVLVSPFARGLHKELWSRTNAIGPEDNQHTSLRCAIVDPTYDWEGDRPLTRPMHESIIYEMHVGGLTRSPSSGVRHPGTFAGVIEKIPYLQALGVTAVELLPVCEFDDSNVSVNPAGDIVRNFWGYSTIAFFSPHSGYCTQAPPAASHAVEFKDMVKALHRAGIEVILDVVFNHTDEGNENGPTHSFRGIDNRTFYLLDPADPAVYLNFSGVGNTINANHPVTQKLIVDCVRYWVNDMHVDGFRFDEGSILSRGEDGRPLSHPPVIWQIEFDDGLADTKLIAEAWDAAGLYQVGHFPGDRWAEWNGQYRDDVRRFLRGEPGLIAAVAARLGGSADIFEARGQSPVNSINFVTGHDGFTLNDLFSYNTKHNEANGEGNRDGTDNNYSWNCGVEGPSADPAVEQLRIRMIKNACVVLMLSRGVPMLLSGDEARRTQRGNNNAYNQDNPTGWFNWTLTETNAGLLRFFQRMVAFRKAHPALRQPYFYRGQTNERGLVDIVWHGTRMFSPGFTDPNGRALAFTIAGFQGDADLHVMMNMFWEPLDFEVPVDPRRAWRVAVDTFATATPGGSYTDIFDPGHEPAFTGRTCTVNPRSIVVLVSELA